MSSYSRKNMLLKGRILWEHIQWQDSARNCLPQEDHIGGVELKFLWINGTGGRVSNVVADLLI